MPQDMRPQFSRLMRRRHAFSSPRRFPYMLRDLCQLALAAIILIAADFLSSFSIRGAAPLTATQAMRGRREVSAAMPCRMRRQRVLL